MRHSIRFKLTFMLIGLVAVTIFTAWAINNIMLKNYFVTNLENKLQTVFSQIDDSLTSNDISMQIRADEIDRLASKSNTTVIVVCQDGYIYSSTSENGKMQESLMTIIKLLRNPQNSEVTSQWTIGSNVTNKDIDLDKIDININDAIRGGIGSGFIYKDGLEPPYFHDNSDGQKYDENGQLVENESKNDDQKENNAILMTNSYIIQQNHDNKMGSDYYDLVGVLSNGDIVAIRASIENINESVQVSNRFFGYVGIVVTILGSIAMFFVSNKFAKPIHNMALIAKKMTDLDFDAKVEGINSKDEIGDLGKSMNELSLKLEYTISDLKSANNQLRKDIEEKVQIDEMRKEFLSHVSHELKTPIALIQGYSEGLKENINDDQESKDFYCDVIIDEANKMNNMVKKLLTLNQIEFGNQQVKFERFDVTVMIGNILNSIKILLGNNDVNIEFNSNESMEVWADEFMIEEVVTNYISNAIHHVSENGKINIFYEKKDKSVRINVFNTGKNIPEEDIEKLWIKFYKVDKARTREYGGSGVGLSIVAATMDAHGKEYGVYNTDNGVVFYFDLDTDIS